MDKILNTNESEFLLYNAGEGRLKVRIVVGDETVWTSARGMAEIFNIDRTGIIKHIQNIYETGELQEDGTCAKIAQVQIEGDREVTRMVDVYNLDVIIAVGYRASSYEATQFRIWATKVLKEYLIKGFALDDDRLKQGNNLFDKVVHQIKETGALPKEIEKAPIPEIKLSDFDQKLKQALNFDPKGKSGEA